MALVLTKRCPDWKCLQFGGLRHFGLKLNPSKCSLIQEQITYVDFGKIRCMQEFPVPQCEKDVRSFVSMCSYYCRFIRNFSRLAAPLNALLSGGNKKKGKSTPQKSQKPIPFAQKWTPQAEEAFMKHNPLVRKSAVAGRQCIPQVGRCRP